MGKIKFNGGDYSIKIDRIILRIPLVILFLGIFFLIKPLAHAEKQEWERTLMDSNRAITEWFNGVVEGIDLFLVGKRISNKPNNSTIRIENSSFMSEGQTYQNKTSFSFNPRLVNLEEYLNLKFTTYDEREDSRGVRNKYLRRTPREENYGATIGLFRKLGNIRTAFQPRIELQDPLKVSHSLSFESVAELKNFYRVNPKLELYASPTRGVGTYQAINLNFDLSSVFGLTFINEGDYQEKSHLYLVTNGVSLGQSLTETSSFSYTFLFISNNQPKYNLSSYNLSIGYSETLYKGMLDYAIVPHLDFLKINQFKGNFGLVFTFNLNFF